MKVQFVSSISPELEKQFVSLREQKGLAMIPSGKAHNEMILGEDQTSGAIDDAGKMLV